MLLTGNMQPAAAEVPASAAQAGETLRLGRLPLLATQALPALLASFVHELWLPRPSANDR
jgi:hypothetical protein